MTLQKETVVQHIMVRVSGDAPGVYPGAAAYSVERIIEIDAQGQKTTLAGTGKELLPEPIDVFGDRFSDLVGEAYLLLQRENTQLLQRERVAQEALSRAQQAREEQLGKLAHDLEVVTEDGKLKALAMEQQVKRIADLKVETETQRATIEALENQVCVLANRNRDLTEGLALSLVKNSD